MGNGHDDHHSIHQKGVYLPMFCRLSIKDVQQSHRHKDPIPAGDPSSPKVSCMGQVKRTNRVVGFPNASSAAHLHKHRRPFPAKALLPNTAVIGGRSGSRSCRTSKEMCVNRSRASRVKTNCDHNGDQECVKVVDIGEMDPPLPVVKRAAAATTGAGRDEVNLWKRRFNNGSEIKCLQIEQIKLQSIKFQPPPSTA